MTAAFPLSRLSSGVAPGARDVRVGAGFGADEVDQVGRRLGPADGDLEGELAQRVGFLHEPATGLGDRGRFLRPAYELLNTGDPATLDLLTTPGYVDHDLPPGVTPRQSIGMFRAGVPDATFRVQDAIAENDRVVVRHVIDATHTGEFFGMPPSRRPVHLEGISIHRVTDGRLAEAWVQYDRAGLIQQLQPAPTAPGATPRP